MIKAQIPKTDFGFLFVVTNFLFGMPPLLVYIKPMFLAPIKSVSRGNFDTFFGFYESGRWNFNDNCKLTIIGYLGFLGEGVKINEFLGKGR